MIRRAVLLSTNVHRICKVKTYKSCCSKAEMEGKNFLITGAANGIGLAVTRVVLGAGARVVMADVDTFSKLNLIWYFKICNLTRQFWKFFG